MSYFFEPQPSAPIPPDQVSPGPSTGFLENRRAQSAIHLASDLTQSMEANLAAAREERRRQIEKISGKSIEETLAPYMPAGGVRHAPRDIGGADSNAELIELQATERYLETVPERQRQGVVIGAAALRERARELALEKIAEAEDVRARSRSFAGEAGSLVGGIGAFLTDPAIIASMAFGAPLSAGIVRTALVEGTIAGGTEIALQPGVQLYRAELGLEAGVEEAAKNVGLAAIGGGIFAGTLKGAAKGFRALTQRELVEAFDQTIGDAATAEQKAARDLVDAYDELMSANPYPDTPLGRDQHVRAARAAEEALATGRPLEAAQESAGEGLSARPRQASKAPEPLGEALPRSGEGVSGMFYRFDPDDLETDASAYQFKAGGDEAGVTDRLAGVTRWHPERAGLTVVHERLDGTRYIADGHQRLGLARRIAAGDPDQKPRLTGMLYREADGYSVDDVRVLAALKNIAEGSGSAIDAAKVLRARPGEALNLPESSALVRDAQGLARLSDDAFGMVVNELVPPRFASLVGRIAADEVAKHAEVLKVLARQKPGSVTEAESMIRDVLSAPAVREVQSSLFGDAATTQILYKERAQVLAAAGTRLRKDRQIFAMLTRDRARIEREGNRLAADVNARRAQEDAHALEELQKLARRKGPVADALARAAERLRAGEPRAAVVSDFLADVRRTAKSDFGGSGAPRGSGRADEGADVGGESAALGAADDPAVTASPLARAAAREGLEADVAESLSLFDAPGGKGQQSQLRQIATDLSRAIDGEGDFDVPTGRIIAQGDDETIETVRASALRDEAIADATFLDGLKGCLR